jgi:hypothetical protein
VYKGLLVVVVLGIPVLSSAQTPMGFEVRGYECHADLSWRVVDGASVYRVYRGSAEAGPYQLMQTTARLSATDWVCDEGQSQPFFYRVAAVGSDGQESAPSLALGATSSLMDDDALVEMVQRATFRYFWDFGHPVSGMARERSNGNGEVVTTGGTGFGVMGVVIGASRGWISREAAVQRLINICSFLQFAERFHGVFPHWMNGTTGKVIPFSQFDNGGDLVETAFLFQGLLTARNYFDGAGALETGLRSVIDGLWEEVEWSWYRRNNSSVLYWHWSPNYGWQMNFPLRGFNETQIVYLLAAAAPLHKVPGSLYQSGWLGSGYNNFSSYYGYPVFCGPYGGGPLFFSHYSYLGFDPRGVKDNCCNYFIRNRNHARIQQAYATLNPKQYEGYSADCWGLTASDDPFVGYKAHDIAYANDNGTITPTAALSSMPYTPEESLRALRHFYRVLGKDIWGPYGFYDAFNETANWVAPSYLAIDQGPILIMLENYRTGLLWEYFMKSPEIGPALTSLGFVEDASATEVTSATNVPVYPNPIRPGSTLYYPCAPGEIIGALTLQDLQGRVLFSRVVEPNPPAQLEIALPENIPSGLYWLTNLSRTRSTKIWVAR